MTGRWRKYQCYHVGTRLYLKCENYAGWSNFIFEDMMQRRTLWDTFISRHLVFTDGTAPLELDFYVPKR